VKSSPAADISGRRKHGTDASRNSGPLVLVTRNSTKLSGTLKNLIDAGRIRLVNGLPG
jgi:hypothetical protein